MKTNHELPGVYCFWNKINNKIYVGSAQDLSTRLQNHFDNVSSNKPLQHAFIKYGLEAFQITQVSTEAHEEAKALEQMCLDYLFSHKAPKYNIADKVGGGCIESKENHRKLCLKGKTKEEHAALCAQGKSKKELLDSCVAGGGNVNKPFTIKEWPNSMVLQAHSLHCPVAQKYLSLRPSKISSKLTDPTCLLFINLNNKIVYLEYIDQTIQERAKLFGRDLIKDLAKAKSKKPFKNSATVIDRDGVVHQLSGYKTYYDAGRAVGLKTKSELSHFCQMLNGNIPSSSGFKLVIK